MGSASVVGWIVSTQPPWSTATSTITEPSFIVATISSVTRTGARAPATRTAPTRRSRAAQHLAMLKLFETQRDDPAAEEVVDVRAAGRG